jgi:CheY-like chemotaxis protein
MLPESILKADRDEEESAHADPSSQAPPPGHRAILVVDDDTNDAMLLQLAFTNTGFDSRIIHLSSGSDALQYLLGLPPFQDRAQHPFPSLILLDLAMPLMDGWGLLSHIRAISRWNNLPVIVLTGSSDPSDVKRARDKGADSFLTKPPHLTGYVELARGLMKDWLHAPAPPAQTIPELSASAIPLLALVASSRGR